MTKKQLTCLVKISETAFIMHRHWLFNACGMNNGMKNVPQKAAPQDNTRDNRLALKSDSTNKNYLVIADFCTNCSPVFYIWNILKTLN